MLCISEYVIFSLACLWLTHISSSIIQVNEEEASLFDMLWLLLASVIFVPLFQKIPGGKDSFILLIDKSSFCLCVPQFFPSLTLNIYNK